MGRRSSLRLRRRSSSIHRAGQSGGHDQRTCIHGRTAVIRVRAAEDQQPAAVFAKRHAGTILADAAGKRQAAANGHVGIQVVGKQQGGRDRWLPLITVKNAVVPELSKVSLPPVPDESV